MRRLELTEVALDLLTLPEERETERRGLSRIRRGRALRRLAQRIDDTPHLFDVGIASGVWQ